MCVNRSKQLLMILQGRPEEEKRWSVPSGEANPDETYEACCAREVWEETGYEAKIGAYLHEKSGISRGTLYKVKYYEAELTGGHPALHDPDGLIYEIGWKTAGEIGELKLSYPEDRSFLMEYASTGASSVLYRSNPLAVRRLGRTNAALLHRWLNDPELLRYYAGRDRAHTPEMVQEHFYPEEDRLNRCIVEYDGLPIGYIQFYLLDEEGRDYYGLEEYGGQRIFGCDQFIGEPAYWNRGVGKQLMSSMLRYLEEEHGAERVVMDPQAWNERAIACYERSGFRKVRLLPAQEWHEGEKRDCWLMEWRAGGANPTG
ncbi:GNAT family N-acetyltransferase [Paenibacillus piri]|uniref:GNAT family N-acetyltransferase n=2 Tax=Paenibacillus piri TaxID=2547395 RepID=A0A4R5L0B8_9BACL|nr:GNAT family N-acetyltransferase [Paenibacillus piri]